MQDLQPAGHEAAARPAELRERRPDIALLAAAERPLTVGEKREVSVGRARCSALHVPYRATPRLPIRPVGQWEVAALVELGEALACSVPPKLLAAGLHPRMLASVPALVLVAFYAVLVALKPVSVTGAFETGMGVAAIRYHHRCGVAVSTVVACLHVSRLQSQPSLTHPPTLPHAFCCQSSYGDHAPPALITLLWWLLLLPATAVGGLYVQYWRRRHAMPMTAATESWVPWLAEQIERGSDPVDLRSYLVKALPISDASTADAMLAEAKARAARH